MKVTAEQAAEEIRKAIREGRDVTVRIKRRKDGQAGVIRLHREV
jgi:RecJ-like exonuclease